MAEQIIRQPDGLFAVFSSVTESFVVVDATADEVVEIRAEDAAERAREQARRELDFVRASNPQGVYHQYAMTWDEAAALDRGAAHDA